MALSNTSFDSRLVTTLSRWVSDHLADVISSQIPIFAMLRMRDNVVVGGGHGGQFVEPFMFPNGSGGAVAGVSNAFTALTFADHTGMTGAAYTVAEYVMPIAVQEYDLDAQGSETEKVKLIKGVIDASLATFTETLNTDMWANSINSNSSQGARTKLASLKTLFNAGTAATTTGGYTPAELTEQLGNRGVCDGSTQTLQSTVGGVPRAASAAGYWCTPIINTAQDISAQVLSNMVTKATRGIEQPDLIVMHPDCYDKLQYLFTHGGGNGGQFFTDSKLAQMGYNAMRFRNAEVIFDPNVPTDSYLNGAATNYNYNIFAINTKYLKLRATSMKPVVKEFPDSRPIKTYRARWSGQLTSGHLGRVHCRHVNINNP